jgi:hypothetical protein
MVHYIFQPIWSSSGALKIAALPSKTRAYFGTVFYGRSAAQN